jgi:hypothetical protein
MSKPSLTNRVKVTNYLKSTNIVLKKEKQMYSNCSKLKVDFSISK